MLAELAIHKESVSRKLTELRELYADPNTGRPLSQERAAARVQVTGRQWQRWESGESVPYPRNLDAIAEAFDIDVADFFTGEEDTVDAKPTSRSAILEQLDRIERIQGEILERLARVEGLADTVHEIDDDLGRLIDLATGRVVADVAAGIASAEEARANPRSASVPGRRGRGSQGRPRAS